MLAHDAVGAQALHGYAQAARVAAQTMREFLAAHTLPDTVVLVTSDEETYRLYEQELSGWA